MDILFHPIGTIHTPYTTHDQVPHQPDPEATGKFYIQLNPELTDGLYRLNTFNYIQVFFFLDRPDKPVTLHVRPPSGGGMEVGLFASRSPRRPNPIGLSTVKLFNISGSRLDISGIDVLDNTPLLDIKPHFKGLDLKDDANDGWRRQS
ncbi:MAG TPA: tRNA (N6-threonylcarbamoyladenosine(37)-N6)-methyltransferase TrmO [Desulfotignum sp.]|nr:tRNA (N6-threonylcarbamoyladenosine(37)-N6)-methyltransferase TrmO [Desulfotignum sp.]